MGMRDTSAMRALALTLVLVGVAARSLAQVIEKRLGQPSAELAWPLLAASVVVYC